MGIVSVYRKLLIDRLAREPEIKVLLLESVCTDLAVKFLFYFILFYTHNTHKKKKGSGT